MPRILIVKLSSMGDIIHALPILHDIKQALPQAQIDWLCEEHYESFLNTHPLIDQTLAIDLRAHKGKLREFVKSTKAQQLKSYFKHHPYDFIIDCQGLLKSAWLAGWTQGKRYGYSFRSAREPLCSLYYHKRFKISKDLHAITRMRMLCAQALNYPLPTDQPNACLSTKRDHSSKLIVLMPFSSWESKHWPPIHWQQLIAQLTEHHYEVAIAWGTEQEKILAQTIIEHSNATLLPPSSIVDMQHILNQAIGFVACDTGFAHLACALDLPGVLLMGPTDNVRTGPITDRQASLSIKLPCRPCHKRQCYLSYAPGELKPKCLADISPASVAGVLIEKISRLDSKHIVIPN